MQIINNTVIESNYSAKYTAWDGAGIQTRIRKESKF